MAMTTVNGKLVNPVASLPAGGTVTITLVDYSDVPVIGFGTADQNEVISSVQVVPSGTGAWTVLLVPNSGIRLANGQAHTAYRITESGASATSTYWIIVTAASPAWVGNLVTTLIGATGGTAAAMAVLGQLIVGGDATVAGTFTLDGTALAAPPGVTTAFLSGDGTWRTPAGPAAPVWYTGSAVPDAGLGANGDMYLRSITGDVYAKASGSWGSPVANTTGPAGAAGATGATGASGSAGAAGPGVASGGTAGQFLKKQSSTNYDTAFAGVIEADVFGLTADLAAKLAAAANLSDLSSAPTARTNLGLGNSATRAVGTTAGTVTAGDDARLAAPWRFNVLAYGAKGDGSTDDTAAIQAAINAAYAYAVANSFYAEIYCPVPTAWYAINGPLVKGGATFGCAQLTLPIHPTTANGVTLAFIGQRDVSATVHWQQTVRQITGVTWKSNSDTAIDNTNGEASIIGGPTPAHGYGTTGSVFTNLMVFWDGIALMGPNATNGVGGLDLRGVAKCGGGSFSYLVDAHPVGGGIVGGSGSGNYFGLALPNNGNNDVCFWQSITIYGMTYGVICAEHTHINSLRAIYCFDPIVVVGTFYSGPTALHGVTIGNASVESVTSGGNHLIFVGSGAKCHIVLDSEDANVVITDQSGSGLNTGDVYLVGTWGTLVLPAATSNVTIHDSTRPAGHAAAPGVPASTTALQNVFGRPAAVTVTGGTVTAIAVDGTATGVTSGTVLVPAGKNITLTYSAAPGWVWTLI